MGREIPLLRILSEGTLIVVSILLAFGIDAWWDGRQEREREEVALAALRSEFLDNRSRLVETRELQNQSRRDALALLELFRTQGDPPGSFEIPDELLYSIGTTHRFIPVTGALTSLLTSGELGIVEHNELRSALSSWPDQLSLLLEREQRERDTSFGIIVPLLHEYVPYATLDHRAGVDGVTGPSAFAEDYEGLLKSLVAENWVEMRQFGLLSRVQQYDELIAEVDSILSMIELRQQ